MNDFRQSLASGHLAESAISRWLQRRGCGVVPAYEVETGHFKGPQFFTADGSFAVPDMLVFGKRCIRWIEAKHKTAFAWNRARGIWVTGVDVRNYLDYQEVAVKSGVPAWLLFLQRGGQAKDSPSSPSGLYGQELRKLAKSENHRGMMGDREMVYWSIDALLKLADIDSVLP